MKSILRYPCVALLALAAGPAFALQLGQIQVRSALNQPLVAAIPLHPKTLTELDGISVGLAPAADFTRAGLRMTAADQTLRFHVVTDNNGQKLILVTSSQPITDPYLDFLVQVNTRQGKQVREFVVLLNPVISAPAPVVETAPTAATPAAAAPPPVPQAAPPTTATPPPAPEPEPQAAPAAPAASAATPQPTPEPAPQPTPQAQTQPQPQPAPQPVPEAQPQAQPTPQPVLQSAATGQAGSVQVEHGDTLYHIATQAAHDTGASINQMMLALKAANPEAFFGDNVNNLKAGAILRIPTRDEVDTRSVAEATAEIRRQMETWRASKPQAATVLTGTAAEAAANTQPQPREGAPTSDHLTLVPPTGAGGGANSRPGVAGGTGSETIAGLRQKLQNDRSSMVSLRQSNDDLESRVQSLKDIADKSDKLLGLKDATIAELQQKLAQLRAGKVAAAPGASATATAATAAAALTPASTRGLGASAAPMTSAVATSAPMPAAAGKAAASARAWYRNPLVWIVGGVVVLVLVVLGLLLGRRKPGGTVAHGPLPDLLDVAPGGAEPADAAAPEERVLHARLVEHPDDLDAHLQLCRLYYARTDAPHFVEEAEAMREEVTDLGGVEWREVLVMGHALAPHHPLFAAPELPADDDPYGLEALRQPAPAAAPTAAPAAPPAIVEDDATVVRPPQPTRAAAAPAAAAPQPVAAPRAAPREPAFSDDPVDTKLDLARAYLDMGDPVGARAMLEEVLAEGTQAQKDEAGKLLAEAGPAP